MRVPSKPLEPVQIDFIEKPPFASQKKSLAEKAGGTEQILKGPPSGKAKNTQQSQLIKKSFDIQMDSAGTDTTGITMFGESATPGKITGSGAWVEQVPFEKGLELTAFWLRLNEKISNGIDYPEDMVRQRIQGDVRADFYVNREGKIVGEFHSVRGSETLLNLYVMSSLLVALKDPLPKNVWADQDKVAISIHVHFSTYSMTETRFRDESSFRNNELSLSKFRYVHLCSHKKWTRFSRVMSRPSFPFPVDFMSTSRG